MGRRVIAKPSPRLVACALLALVWTIPVRHPQAEQPLLLLFVGDSITAGWQAHPQLWREKYAPYGAGYLGKVGILVEWVMYRVKEGALDKIKPKVTVLMIGTNNIESSSGKKVAAEISGLVHLIRSRSSTRVLLLGILPRDREPGTHNRREIAAANASLATLDDGDYVRFLDMGSRFLEADGTISPTVMPDFVHLSKRGYEIWAEAMQPLLNEMMRK
jgi:lysophospholipase L1-like esterase